VLTAFGSVELDLQTQFPDMLYSDLLEKVHAVLEERFEALSGGEPKSRAHKGDPTVTSTSTRIAPEEIQNAHKTFGNSIKHWPLFPDTCSALIRLSTHFKLIVLSNVDRTSFRHSHALLSGEPNPTPESRLKLYTYPENNPYKYWHPKLEANSTTSKSPFSLIITAQDTGCYKPAPGGFLAALGYINDQPDLFGNIARSSKVAPTEGEEDIALESIKDKVLSVAQSLTHDHEPASKLGLRSVWIDRQSAVTCNETPGGPGAEKKWTWRFETLAEMADAVEKELTAN
jgi:FMN phosphatase YigB (HAD superfamily)